MNYGNHKKVEKHFLQKKEHTKIKHRIFENALKNCIYIANIQISKNTKLKKNFVYVDLFAGAGEFDTGEKGSILLAIDIIKSHIITEKSKDVKNYFDNFLVIAIEENDKAYDKLEKSLKELERELGHSFIKVFLLKENLENYNDELENESVSSFIKVILLKGNWENYHGKLENELRSFDWGFIFVDPFSTELDILKLKELLKSKDYTKMKDILIFFNLQALRREKGKMTKASKQRLEKTVGLSWEEIEKNQDLSETVRGSIIKNFSGIKDFAVGVSYPVEVKDKLYTMDYFYLVLLTNSVGLINRFLEGYEEIFKENFSFTFKNKKLFDVNYYLPESDIFLLKYWEEKVNKFLSWKNLKEIGYDEIPTIENLVKRLNDYRKRGMLDFVCDDRYKYKRKSGDIEKGDLKYSEIKSKKDMQSITIKVINHDRSRA